MSTPMKTPPEDFAETGLAKKLALRILGDRTLSSHELEKRLINKGETEETAKKTVRWLEDTGLINDAEYASMIVKHYNSKGYGVGRIRDELFRRGIDREMWDDALCVLANTESTDAVMAFLNKKLRGSVDRDNLRRAVSALVRRGFSYEEAREAISGYEEENRVNIPRMCEESS